VQGVGFRPFIYRLAREFGLNGQVDNRNYGVLINVEGDEGKVVEFQKRITENAPVASHIKSLEIKNAPLSGYKSFSISASGNTDNRITDVSPDIAVCDECLFDLVRDERRIDYPFINCTGCGPRFTIIEDLPYDRERTTMRDFRLCPGCMADYNNILDRRFHAQPVACNECGPVYTYRKKDMTISNFSRLIIEIAGDISSGRIVAIKGLGGYHLICDAHNDEAVSRLRQRKHRDAKPFAVLFRDIPAVREYCYADLNEERELLSWRRPVVILRQKKHIPPCINSRLDTIGAILPYMPVHYMIFRHIRSDMLVFTSGNLSDEPVITDDSEAWERLPAVADSIATYNRKISNRADDSVVKIAGGRSVIIRRSRGYVPEPVDLRQNADGIFAAGAEQKNSFCIGRDNQAVMSQYIGDLKDAGVNEFFEESVEKFMKLFRFTPAYVVCDLHPEYKSTLYAERFAERLGIPLFRVQHHHAHIASVLAEKQMDEQVIGISMDGTGFGTDGNIWGSEFMISDLRGFQRYTHFDYFPLPGGDRAVDEPWRMAFSCLYKYYGKSIEYESIPLFRSIGDCKISALSEMIDKRINSPLSAGAGRLFDAVSSLLGLCDTVSFDSEPPMRLESVIKCRTDEYYPFSAGGTVSFSDTFGEILKDMNKGDISLISAKFHNTIARVILDVSETMRNDTGINKVVLSGGVFQNSCLLERSLFLLKESGFEVFTNNLVPVNDGGISLGQLVAGSKLI
jgi:hydrogenase maturation protein HypF